MLKISKSPWVLHYDGSSCNGCDIEVLATLTPVYDAERFGIVNTGNPLHADILLITGGINTQNEEVARQIYEQMPEPKYVIAMGACTCGGGMFAKTSYSVVKGIDRIIPVDIYLPMCPPKPESLLDAIRKLQLKIKTESIMDRKKFMAAHNSKLKESCGILINNELEVTKLGVE